MDLQADVQWALPIWMASRTEDTSAQEGVEAVRVGSLFSGIGGIDLGLERAGFEIAWQVEIDEWCRQVLTKHWPDVPKYGDIRGLTGLEEVDVIAGGFPCQDVSNAGTTHAGGLQGLDGARSGLWREFDRIVCELQPRWVVVENVAALTARGLDAVLYDLAAGGFDADWTVLSAGAMGAPHIRKRLFIVARRRVRFAHEMDGCPCECDEPWCPECEDHYADCVHPGPDSWVDSLSDAFSEGPQGLERSILAQSRDWRSDADVARSTWWSSEPDVGRVAHGIPKRVDRLRGLGNAVVPQIVTWIGERLMEWEVKETLKEGL